MNYEEIEKFMKVKNGQGLPVLIHFKTRKPITGLFIQGRDFEELRRKNFWRIVSEKNIDTFRSSRDTQLAKIFNGAEMTRLEMI